MDNQRFSETPPGSPKSCMKASRKLTFEEKESDPSPDVPTRSPRKGTKVYIRSPGESSSPKPVLFQQPPDIQFSEHFEQGEIYPNCTYSDQQPTTSTSEPDDLMEVASMFVNEIIETATLEAANRQKAESDIKPNLTSIARDIIQTGRRSVWVQRAQGTVSKWFTTLCTKAQNSIRT